MTDFKDHFSKQSSSYGRFRPGYPDAFFQFLSDQAGAHDLVWDCATGTGQAARSLCPFFDQVVATDASYEQIKNAHGPANILFRQAPAEQSGLKDQSVDLINVAQALHWFNHDEFYKEVRRVLKPDGLICVYCYELMRISPEIDALILKFYDGLIGPYWPKERYHIEQGYQSLPFPFVERAVPDFEMAEDWTCEQLLGYLGTWSATQRYKDDLGHDAVALIEGEMRSLWGSVKARKIIWPLSIRMGRLRRV